MRTPKYNRSSRSQASKGSASTARNAAAKKNRLVDESDKLSFYALAAELSEQLHTYSEYDLAKIMKHQTLLMMDCNSSHRNVNADCITSFAMLSEMIVWIASNRQEFDEMADYFRSKQTKLENIILKDE